MSVRPAVTRALAQRQRWRCIWCEFAMAADQIAADQLVQRECPANVLAAALMPLSRRSAALWIRVSFEHFVPHSHGGLATGANGFAACCWCNRYRGTEDPIIFKARVVALVAAGKHPRQIFRRTGRWPSVMPPRLGLTADTLAKALAS